MCVVATFFMLRASYFFACSTEPRGRASSEILQPSMDQMWPTGWGLETPALIQRSVRQHVRIIESFILNPTHFHLCVQLAWTLTQAKIIWLNYKMFCQPVSDKRDMTA